MPERFDLKYEVMRDDWLAVNEAWMRESSEWQDAATRHRRAMRRQMLLWAPVCIVVPALLVGSGRSTHGMYLEGAAVGACFAVFLYFALPRLNTVDKLKEAQIERLQRADLSEHAGPTTVAMDELGVHIQSPNRQMKLSWQAVAPRTVGGFVLLQHISGDATIVPRRAFASDAAATEFLDQAGRWWQAAQRPHAERLERYLADRDRPCPRCAYNLRGMRGEACPECGEVIRLDALVE